jgi:hypothetical protein
MPDLLRPPRALSRHISHFPDPAHASFISEFSDFPARPFAASHPSKNINPRMAARDVA